MRELVRPGAVVVDLASGTGILGLLACRAGASRVYAIEMDPIADLARAVADANGFADRITVIRGHSRDVSLPERADLVVSDQIGRFAFDAGILQLFADARARFLKPDGAVAPSRLDLCIAPVENARQSARVAFWTRKPAGFDFSPAHRIATNTGYPVRLAPAQLLAAPRIGATLDLRGATPVPLRLQSTFTIERAATLHGVAGWFAAQLSPSIAATNSPLDPHRIARRQAFFPVKTPVGVTEGDEVAVSMRILPDDMVVSWTVSIRPRTGEATTSEHSTLSGMLIDPMDVRMTGPAYRPRLTPRGDARRTVLELCDGHRTLADIERDVFERHRTLFASAAEAATFVGEVVTRYTRDAG